MPLLAIPFPAIDPVAIVIGPFVVRWYALAYIAGLLLGWRYCLILADRPPRLVERRDIDDFLVWATLGVVRRARPPARDQSLLVRARQRKVLRPKRATARMARDDGSGTGSNISKLGWAKFKVGVNRSVLPPVLPNAVKVPLKVAEVLPLPKAYKAVTTSLLVLSWERPSSS
jgi:hypothetical protein